MPRLESASERATCDIGDLCARDTTRQTRMQLLRMGRLLRVAKSRHCMWQKIPKDGGCPWRLIPTRGVQHAPKPREHSPTSPHPTHIATARANILHKIHRSAKIFRHRSRITCLSQHSLYKPSIHQSNALSLPLDFHYPMQARANFLSVPSLPRPTRSRVVPSSRLVCTYIYKATECELAPLMSQISNVHPATLS